MIDWPDDHPLRADAVLSSWARHADELFPDGRVVATLRYLPRRRVASLLERGAQRAVLKVFAGPRARGNHRRLRAIHATTASSVVQRPIGVDTTGHVALLDYVEGTAMPDLDDDLYVHAAALGGSALALLHRSGADLDRAWGLADELAQLQRTTGRSSAPVVELVAGTTIVDETAPPVPSHRDCHPAQLILTAGGAAIWIDLDDCALAPPGLDVGNFVAHLDLEAACARRTAPVVRAAVQAFLAGYGEVAGDVDAWRRLSLARLSALAETRHRDHEQMRRLAELIR